MAFKLRSGNGPPPFKQMGSSPAKHGNNPAGDKPHTKFKTETEHEEYHDIHPTKDLNKAEMKKASDEYAKTHFPGGTKKSERDKFSDRETQREIEKESSPDWLDEQRKPKKKSPAEQRGRYRKGAEKVLKAVNPVIQGVKVAKDVSKATIKGLKKRTKKETKTGFKNPGVRKI